MYSTFALFSTTTSDQSFNSSTADPPQTMNDSIESLVYYTSLPSARFGLTGSVLIAKFLFLVRSREGFPQHKLPVFSLYISSHRGSHRFLFFLVWDFQTHFSNYSPLSYPGSDVSVWRLSLCIPRPCLPPFSSRILMTPSSEISQTFFPSFSLW